MFKRVCRRIARELVEKWSRPIFDQYREQGPEVQQQREQELAAARQRRQLREAKNTTAQSEYLHHVTSDSQLHTCAKDCNMRLQQQYVVTRLLASRLLT